MSPIVKIQKGIKKPIKSGRHSHYPLKDMQIGDSFAQYYRGKKHRSKIILAWINFKKHEPTRKFSYRIVKEDGKTRIRVWRDK